MSVKQDIEDLESQLKITPDDLSLRIKLLDLLFHSGQLFTEQQKQHIIWIIENRSDADAPWKEWSVHFMLPNEPVGIRALWEQQINKDSKNINIKKHAAEMLTNIDIGFSIDCWRQVLRSSPDDRDVQESLAFSLFLQASDSEEAFKIFKSLYSKQSILGKIRSFLSNLTFAPERLNQESSIFMLSIAALNAFDIGHSNDFKKYSEAIDKRMSISLNDRFDLHPGYSVLALDAASNCLTKIIDNRLQNLLQLSSLGYSSLVMYDFRIIKKLMKNDFREQANSLIEAYLKKDKNSEIRAFIKNLDLTELS
ncbi:hypothetical protein ACLVWU_13570 [Bdellovibrio sp. HCB290]|uniref:hypothetical protein n=1 Tax=Bdellovibrio sp. HCB290 TaxID=3394356 RepID=UPI0039B38371